MGLAFQLTDAGYLVIERWKGGAGKREARVEEGKVLRGKSSGESALVLRLVLTEDEMEQLRTLLAGKKK